MKSRLKHCLGEAALLKGQKAWNQILDLFYPVQDKQPELTAAGLDAELRLEVGFALGQLGKYDQALKEYEHCLRIDPDHYLAVNSLAYTLYNSLFAAKNREILLTPEARKQRIEKAHTAFRKAQALRPDQVTNFYREGMLFKSLENKPDLALDCFARAVANWDAYTPEQKEARHQERKNFIKALYNLASCQSRRNNYTAARTNLQRCLAEDRQSGHLKPEHKHFALGKVCYFLAEYEQGVEHLQMAAQLVGPVEGDYVFELLARTRLAQGRLEKGLETLRRIPGKNRRPYVRWTEADLLHVCAAGGCLSPGDVYHACFNLEVFPKQDRLAGKGLGNLVKLPLGIHRGTGRRSHFVPRQGRTVWEELECLRTVQRQVFAAARQGRAFSLREEKVENLKQLVLAGHTSLSGAVLNTLINQRVETVLLDSRFQFRARLHLDEHKHVQRRTAQYCKLTDPAFALKTARMIVQGKLRHQARLLQLRGRQHKDEPLLSLAAAVRTIAGSLERADSMELIRGAKGQGSRLYFQGFGRMIRHQEFAFSVRNKRPPLDPVNALLSFGNEAPHPAGLCSGV